MSGVNLRIWGSIPEGSERFLVMTPGEDDILS